MNIQEYISSGILESYVLGGLSREEALEVENMASQYPEVKKELEEIQESLNNYAKSHSKMPNASLKQKILDKIDEQEKAPEEETIIISLKKKNQFTEYLAAASIGFAVLCAGSAYFFFTKWQDAENKVMTMEAQNAVISQHSNAVNYNLQKELDGTLNILSAVLDTSTTSVELKGLPIAPSSRAVVYWNKNSEAVYLSLNNLPEAPKDKQYQLWAIKDGKPVDAGVFDLNYPIHKMNSIDNAQAFAVTLEKKGGSPSPTMDAMYLIGNI